MEVQTENPVRDLKAARWRIVGAGAGVRTDDRIHEANRTRRSPRPEANSLVTRVYCAAWTLKAL